jgi:SulP family sulfate permease
MPGSGSFTRSALQYAVGARTRVANLFCAAFNLIVFLLLYKEARFIPFATLAAIVFIVGATLIDWRNITRIMRTSRSEAIVCVITFLAALLLPLTYAIYVGVFLNLGLYIHQASHLHMTQMVPGQGSLFQERPLSDKAGQQSVVFLSLEGDLFFGVADELQDRFGDLGRSAEVRVVIFRLKRTHMIDSTVFNVFDLFAKAMQKRGGHVIFCGVKPELYRQMKNFGLVATVGDENIFPSQAGIFASAKEAIRRARFLVGSSIDADAILQEPESESGYVEWTYQI